MKKLEEFEQFRKTKGMSYFAGKYESKYSKDTYGEFDWYVDGSGRAIIARILVNGRIIREKMWSYDCILEFKRQSNHKRMLLDALNWASTNSEDGE